VQISAKKVRENQMDEQEEKTVFHNESGAKFVNVYWVERHYGGREEGGWWYDTGDLEQSYLCPSDKEAETKAESLDLDAMNEGLYDLSSVLATGVFQINISDTPGESWPKERPFYE
jgi:hypothetical protein